jgi:hypothetical protein
LGADLGRCRECNGAAVRSVLGEALQSLRGWHGGPSPSRFRAARPPTFFVLAKKVGKESRAHEAAACGGALCCSNGPAAIETRTISRLRREPRASDSRWPKTPARPALLGGFEGQTPSPCRHRDGVTPLEDAAAVRGNSGEVPGACLSPWRGAAAIGRVSRTARWCPAAQGKPQAGLVRSPFFAYFLWRSKESRRPRAVSGRSSKNDDAGRAAALGRIVVRRAIDLSC